MGYGHWVLVTLMTFILLLMEWKNGNVAKNPFIASGIMICIGIVIGFVNGDFKNVSFVRFMLFADVDFASTTVAVGYSLFVFGLAAPIISSIKKNNGGRDQIDRRR